LNLFIEIESVFCGWDVTGNGLIVFVGCVERPYRETQHYDDGNTEIVALMKLTRPTNCNKSFNLSYCGFDL
jgi:hypothetical protein